jgi:hypothetical protein
VLCAQESKVHVEDFLQFSALTVEGVYRYSNSQDSPMPPSASLNIDVRSPRAVLTPEVVRACLQVRSGDCVVAVAPSSPLRQLRVPHCFRSSRIILEIVSTR